MKFRCNSTDFLNALSTATHALPTRTTLPALECVLIETDEDNFLRLTCSDSSLTLIAKCPAEIEEGGEVLLPGKLLAEISRKMPEGEMSVTNTENGYMTLRCMGFRMQIAARAANLYPAVGRMEEDEENAAITLPQGLLRDMILKTSFAIATDEERPILTGCLLDVQGGEARMVALDGFRMAIRMQRVNDSSTISAVIPGKALQEIARILSDDEEETITISLRAGRMYTRIGDTEIYTILKEGEYINYRQITPSEWRTKVELESKELASCVERASLIAREGKNNIVQLSIGDGKLAITSNSEVGDIYEEMPAEIEGEDLRIGFNVKFLSDALKALDGRRIVMRFISSVNPCVVVPADGDDFLHLILPLRLRA